VEFATKPELAIGMLTRALDAGVPASWVTGDEVYGQHPGLRAFLQARGMSYVLCVASNQWVWVDSQPGSAGAGGLAGRKQLQVKTLAVTVPPRAFKKLSAGKGAKGPRIYSWARTPVRLPGKPDEPPKAGWLLTRRSLADPSDCAYYLCSAPAGTTLATLVAVAGKRWEGRSRPGPLPSPSLRRLVPTYDPRDVRARLPHRHPRRQRGKGGAAEPDEDLIPLTVPEVRRLLSKLIWNRPATPTAVLGWSLWRRRHQARARRFHYAARGASP